VDTKGLNQLDSGCPQALAFPHASKLTVPSRPLETGKLRCSNVGLRWSEIRQHTRIVFTCLSVLAVLPGPPPYLTDPPSPGEVQEPRYVSLARLAGPLLIS
jgi:hypothetical protein